MIQTTQSQTIGKLADALCKVQASMRTAKKEAENPFFKSKYADLAGCWDACRKPLTDNGLAVIQTTAFDDASTTAHVIIETTLAHISGEWIRGSMKMPLTKLDPQSVGSAITYGRRYGLSAIVGIISDDDDAEAAMGRGGASESTPHTAPSKTANKGQKTKGELIRQMFGALGTNGLGLTKDEMTDFISRTITRKVASSDELNETELKKVIDTAHDLQKKRDAA